MRVYWWGTGLHFKPESKEDKELLLSCTKAVENLSFRFEPLRGVPDVIDSKAENKDAITVGSIVHER